MFRDQRVHVVIPAYNVAEHIGAVLRGLPGFVDAVTVVDDGSTDGTAEAAKSVGDRRVTLLQSPVNEGVGGAMVRGFRHALARGEGIVVKMDGDGQMDPADLPRLLEPIADGRCAYAKGNRFLMSQELDIMPKARLAGNFVLTFLTKLASGYWNVFDPQNGYLAVASRALGLLDLDRLSRCYFLENDMLINLSIFDARVCATWPCPRATVLNARPCGSDASSAPSPTTSSAATGTASTASTCCGISRPWRSSCSRGCRSLGLGDGVRRLHLGAIVAAQPVRLDGDGDAERPAFPGRFRVGAAGFGAGDPRHAALDLLWTRHHGRPAPPVSRGTRTRKSRPLRCRRSGRAERAPG